MGRSFILLLLGALTALGGCSSHVPLVIQIQARAEAADPVVTYFDRRTGLRFTDHHQEVRRRVIFLSRARLRQIIRRLYSGRRFMRIPDTTAIEMHFFNYGRDRLHVDYTRFRIRAVRSGRIVGPLDPRTFDRDYYGSGMSGLPYEYAFAARDSFRFQMPVPDWFSAARARRTGSTLEYTRRREANWRRLDRLQKRARGLAPGRELKGIALFPLLQPGEDYVLEYRTTGDGDAIVFRPFHFQLKRVRSPRDTGDTATRRRVWFAFQDDQAIIRRETGETLIMHEQLRNHDRLRQSKSD